MPLSEFYSMASGSLESSQQKRTTFSTDLSDVPGNEFVELVWENGQIMMQGQSSRARKSSTSSNFQPQTPKPRDDKDLENATISKTGKFGLMDSFLNGFATAVPSGGMGLDQDDDELVPWLNYPIDDSLQNDYCSELLPDLSGVTVNELLAQNSFASNDRRNGCNPTISGSHSLEHTNEPKVPSSEVGESSRWRNGQFYPLPFQESQTPFPSLRSGVSNITNNNTSNAKSGVCEDSNQALASAGGFSGIKIQKQDSGQPNTDSGIMNFSHFSRPAALAAALVRANLQNVGSVVTPGTSGIEGSREKNKETTPSSSNLAKPALINLLRGLRTEMGSQSQPNLVPLKVGSKLMMAKPLEESHSAQQSEAVCREDAVKNIGATASKGMRGGEKTAEPVASSSACSGNSAERASNSLTHYLRRKCRETDDSEGRSEDAEEESVGIRKIPHDQRGTTSKRSRAAEVHNLSERRRRDRINERMRALQELIPNCNKVDKASMLDEAIEYLKTLQLQVQIMSMGAGLYMPPMMLPTGMQHIHAAHMSRFSPMGMGVGMGIGMGMLDLNCGSPGCPMIPVAPIQGAHFPAPLSAPIFGSTNFQGMAGPNFPVFGHPGQGLPVSAPRAPLVPFLGGPPINSAMELNASGMAATVGVPNTAPSSNPKDLIQSANSQMMHHTDASSSMNQISNQCQATNEGLEQSSLVLKSDQAPDVGSSGDVSLTKENDIVQQTRF